VPSFVTVARPDTCSVQKVTQPLGLVALRLDQQSLPPKLVGMIDGVRYQLVAEGVDLKGQRLGLDGPVESVADLVRVHIFFGLHFSRGAWRLL
jgi:hypothetical protein